MAALSDWLPASLQTGATILSAGGEFTRANVLRGTASRRKAVDEYEAKQLDTEAGQSRSVALRGTQDQQLKGELINSSALAKAAASGAGASDPTVINIMARTNDESRYRQALAMYEGEAQARLNLMRADALRYEGAMGEQDAKIASNAANMGGAATLLSGGVKALSMYDKYWAGS